MINLDKEEAPINEVIEHYRADDESHDVFGVILYNETSPYLIRVLRDDTFWSALDTISGPRWPIFSIRPKEGGTVTEMPRGSREFTQFLVPISKWQEPDENRKLLEFFNIQTTEELPLLMIFAMGEDGIAYQAQIKLEGKSETECFNSLEKVVRSISSAIQDVEEENIKNTETVFALMKDSLSQEILVRRVKKGIDVGKHLAALIKLFGVGS